MGTEKVSMFTVGGIVTLTYGGKTYRGRDIRVDGPVVYISGAVEEDQMVTISGNGNISVGGSVTINGKTYRGNNISVVNDVVYIDGKPAEEAGPEEGTNILRVEITGDVSMVQCDRAVTVKGNVGGDVDANGSVQCNDVEGTVTAGGSVQCDAVGGSVSAGGSVQCDDVGGSVNAGGSVRRS